MIRGFFFDLDGTLVDTHQANFQAYKQALAEFGIDISFDDFKKTIGRQFNDFIVTIAPTLQASDYSAVSERKAQHYKELLHLSQLNTQLVDFLKLMGDHHAIVLVTTARRVNAEAVLQHHNLQTYFDEIICAEDVQASKPAPDAYQLALTKTGLQPDEVVAFEDSLSGQQAAEAAGIAVVLIRDFAV